MKTTFIIPSKGRPTLANTLISLYSQTAPNWNAIVCFDAVEPTIQSNAKVTAIHSKQKLGIGVNGAGAVRNYAIEQASKQHLLGDWIAFVDDDDILEPVYLYDLENYTNVYEPQNDPDIIVFGMKYTDGTFLPPRDEKDINKLENKIGISFACKRYVFNKIQFEPSSGEDFNFLKRAQDLGLKIIISDWINYLVAPLGCPPDRRK